MLRGIDVVMRIFAAIIMVVVVMTMRYPRNPDTAWICITIALVGIMISISIERIRPPKLK